MDTCIPVSALRLCFWATHSAIVGIDIPVIIGCITLVDEVRKIVEFARSAF